VTAEPAILQVESITSGYGEAMVVRGVDLSIAPGEIVALLGKNGMGKSTLLKSIMGYLPVKQGCVWLRGRNVTGYPPHRMARQAIAYSPQEQAIFQDLTIQENLLLTLPGKQYFSQEFDRVSSIFPVLAQRLKQRAGTLSGGEQKMLLVARALMKRPDLILIDEITEGLQPSVIHRLAETLVSERLQNNVAMLVVEQNIDFALTVSDRWAVLKLGEIDETGSSQDSDADKRISRHLTI